jgi:tetratricopeptide (TPR) repeat protein
MKIRLCVWQLLIVFLFAGMISCKDSDTADDLLLRAPYKGVTDSIERFPSNAELYLQRGLLLSQNNLHELAHRDYKKAFEIQPDERVTLIYVANLLMVNKVKQAVDLLRESIKRYPQNQEFRRRLSDIYIETHNYSKAREEYDSMLAVDSFDFETWHNKGAVLLQLNDTAGAIAAYERSFELQPIQYTGMKLADIYVAMKNPRALEICNMLLARDTTAVATDALFMKGVYYTETNQFNKALQVFDSCISHEWTMIDAHIEKGIIYFQQKKYDAALKTFATASLVSNVNADAYYWQGRCYEAKGEKDNAIANYNRAVSLEPGFREAKERAGRLREMQ